MPFQSRHFSTGRPKSALFFCSNSHFYFFPLISQKRSVILSPQSEYGGKFPVSGWPLGHSAFILCHIVFSASLRRRICTFFGYRLVGVPFWYADADFLPAGCRLFRLPKRICAFSYTGGFRKPHVPKHSSNNDFAALPGKTAGLLFQ